jgi:hypothetical protein
VPVQRPNAHAAAPSVTSDSAVRVASRVSEMSLTLVESTRFRTARISYAPAHLFRASAMCHQRTWLAATLQIRRAFGPSLKEYAIRATCGHAYASWAFTQQVRQLDTAVIADRMLNLGIRHIP